MSLGKRLFAGAKKLVLSEHYDIIEYTGNGVSTRNLTTSFQPDCMWIVPYSTTTWSVQSPWSTRLMGNGTTYPLYNRWADSANEENSNVFNSWLSNGIKVGSAMNENGKKYICMLWKLGNNTSNPDVNLDLGMSTRTWTGNSSYRNMTHGLGTNNVFVTTTSLSSGHQTKGKAIGVSATDYVSLADTQGCKDDYWIWQDQSPTTTTFRLGTRETCNYSGYSYVGWLFTPKEGATAMSTYNGNGGPSVSVNCGFKPSFIMQGAGTENDAFAASYCSNRHQGTDTGLYTWGLNSGTSGRWYGSNTTIDFTNTGFTINSTSHANNKSGSKYWYIAFGDPDL